MIVVDSNVLVYLYLPTELSSQAEKLLGIDPEWVAPRLWRSEMRNVLGLYIRQKAITLEQAYRIQTSAETLLADREFDVPSHDVLRLVSQSSCSAYDCEFVALARRLDTKLVTADQKILKAFPDTAVSLTAAA
ncbi:MAG: type II toxin-antitoxin system VapC family toxin [Gammaproteobacteria bacterium]|nr:type II toxin-antitoxin system VapC family toxin [Gammaproteobacteria bacterium]